MIVLAPDLGHLTLDQLEAELVRLRTLDLDGSNLDEEDRALLIANVREHIRARRAPTDEELAKRFTPTQIRKINEFFARLEQKMLTRQPRPFPDRRRDG